MGRTRKLNRTPRFVRIADDIDQEAQHWARVRGCNMTDYYEAAVMYLNAQYASLGQRLVAAQLDALARTRKATSVRIIDEEGHRHDAPSRTAR